jgi:WhiB family redox-sensing transcriptional regulator
MRDTADPWCPTSWRPARVHGPDWRDQAACASQDPELFFPITTLGPARPQVEAARQVCLRCPVRLPCLNWALDTGQDAGIWGGMTDQERRLLRHRQLRPPVAASVTCTTQANVDHSGLPASPA